MNSTVTIENGQIDILFKQKIHWFRVLFILLWCCAAIYLPFYSRSNSDETWETVLALLFSTMGCWFFYNGVLLPLFKERVSINSISFTHVTPILKQEKRYDTKKISDLRKSILGGYFTFKYDNSDVCFGDGIEDKDGEEIMDIILKEYPQMGRIEQLSAEHKKIEDEYWEVV